MKGLKWTAAIAGIVFVVAIAASMIFAVAGYGSVQQMAEKLWQEGTNHKDGEFTESMNNVQNLRIDLDAAEITISRRAQSDITVTYSCSEITTYPDKSEPIKLERRGNSMELSMRKKWNWFWIGVNLRNIKVDIVLPESYDGNLDIDVDAGSLTLDGDQTFDNVDVDIDAATIKLGDLCAENVSINLDAGQVSSQSLKASKIMLDVDAGTAKLSGVSAAMDVSLDAGKVTVEFAELTGDTSLDINAGSAEILFPASPGAELQLSSDMGSVRQKFGAAFSGSEKNNAVNGRVGDGEFSITADVDMGSLLVGPV